MSRAVRSEDGKARRREQQKAKRQASEAFVREYKLAAGCKDCGYNEHSCALDFDHLPGHVKLFTLNTLGGRSVESILAEIAKCEVVCSNCHRVRTQKRKTGK